MAATLDGVGRELLIDLSSSLDTRDVLVENSSTWCRGNLFKKKRVCCVVNYYYKFKCEHIQGGISQVDFEIIREFEGVTLSCDLCEGIFI